MPTLSHHQLLRITQALDTDFRAAKIQAIRDTGAGRLSLELYGEGNKRWLQLWALPGCSGLHLCSGTPPSRNEGAGIFVRELRRRILNARIQNFQADNSDRILRISLETRDESFTLIFEIFGTSPNLFLLDQEARVLIQFRPAASGRRNLHPGSTYIQPDPGPPRSSPPPKEAPPLDELHKDLEEAFLQSLVDLSRAQYQSQHLKPLKQEIKKTTRLITRLEGDRIRAGDPDLIRSQAHILAANLRGLAKGLTEVHLENPGIEGLPERVLIPLNPALAPKENMEKMYQRARRATRTRDQVGQRLGDTKKKLVELQKELRELEKGEGQGSETPTEAATHPPSNQNNAKSSLAKGIERVAHIHRESDGTMILVGKNARSNDELLRRFAHGNDHWLHVRDGRGSHVIVRPAPGTDAKDAVIQRAASLAAGHSSLRKEAQVDVLWTRCKYVRSAKGAPVGTVHVASSRTLRVKPKRSDG